MSRCPSPSSILPEGASDRRRNNLKDWAAKYERLTQMVVPRSAVKVAQDDEFTLFVVAIFRRVKDEFSQRCREEKCVATLREPA